uniref:Replication protein n=1 Tax=uncultured prokaryote TaxID=198431 RepID=A0A0H5Q4S5_9ZZZZ|nr:hypothetical protein [uncultured prokaryote]
MQVATPAADATAARGRALAAGGAAALGSNAKYSAPPETVDLDTGEITGGEPVYNPMLARVQRFMLQSVARRFLPESRTDKCMRLRQGSKEIQVWQSKEHKTTSYSGLQTCGSVWACPVCSAKIAERRRVEIIAAMAAHKAAGGCMHLLTLTAPHQRSDALQALLARQAAALKKMFADKTVRKIFAALGVVGQIRALEVTHGRLSTHNNGWHPHYHLLLFSGAGVALGNATVDQIKQWTIRLYERWLACCLAAGLGAPSIEHGLKLDDGSKAAKYVAKWGLEDEMTKGHTKRAIHGETPFDFLRAHLVDKTDKQAGALFKEFAETFKGKRQLHWSPGLKKRFAIGEATDEELAIQMEDHAAMLGTITLDQWRDVLAVDGRGTVLMLAANGGWESVALYLGTIEGRGIKREKSPKGNDG